MACGIQIRVLIIASLGKDQKVDDDSWQIDPHVVLYVMSRYFFRLLDVLSFTDCPQK